MPPEIEFLSRKIGKRMSSNAAISKRNPVASSLLWVRPRACSSRNLEWAGEARRRFVLWHFAVKHLKVNGHESRLRYTL
jgi:hypothetical protein